MISPRREQRILGFLKRLNSHLVRDAGKLPQEVTQRVPALKVIDEVLEGNPGATKARRSIQDLWISHDDRIRHNRSYSTRLE